MKKTRTKQQIKSKPSCTVILKSESVDEPFIRYYTGLKVDSGLLIIFPKRKPLFFHSPLEKPPLLTKFESKPFTIVEVEKVFKKIKPKIVGYDKRHLSVAGLQFLKKTIKGATFVDESLNLAGKTIIKTPAEIRNHKKAAKLTELILAKLLKAIPQIKYENEAISFLKIESLQVGAELSFEPIVASGKHACNPHYTPKPKTRLQKGFCIIDFGVRYNGYCADISRTIYIGSPSKKEKEAYQQVLEYIISLEKTLKAKKKLVKNPWTIPHALGHGIGLQVHENPLVGKDMLKENMTIAVEPGMYTKQFGIRIEDNYVVQKNSLKRISTGSRTLKSIKK
ncbi:Xaa-Pro peptidase family protein [Candidatus Woesearchaeota archaeon]|nr:Xaa-Pro peptidase family protein [Candidatus Woesearchaeota archaeon]